MLWLGVCGGEIEFKDWGGGSWQRERDRKQSERREEWGQLWEKWSVVRELEEERGGKREKARKEGGKRKERGRGEDSAGCSAA